MTTRYFETDLNCNKCVSKVTPFLNDDQGVAEWSVDINDPRKVLKVSGENVSPDHISTLVERSGFHVKRELPVDEPSRESTGHTHHKEHAESEGFQLKTYYPLLLIVGFLLLVTGLVEFRAGEWATMRAMSTFMGGFFLAFSFFKLLDVRGFADAFKSYDLGARHVPGYAIAYPFIELALGIAYLTNFVPVATNAVTLFVMVLGLIGVSNALFNKRTIQCACLGTVFDLPMSKVTFIEDATMALMAGAMLWHLLG